MWNTLGQRIGAAPAEIHIREPRMRILVVEDDYLVATSLCAEVIGLGADVIGPFADPAVALEQLALATAAILDVCLAHGTSYAIADHLLASDVPFLFYTGWLATAPARFRQVPLFQKPTSTQVLLDSLRVQRPAPPSGSHASPEELVAFLRQRARALVADPKAADRLVELTLATAVDELGPSSPPANTEAWLVGLLTRQFRRTGHRLLN